MKAFFQRLLFGPQGRSIEHPVLGRAALIETKSGAYWEAEPQWGGHAIGVGINTVGGEEPTSNQVRFYLGIIADLPAAFARAAPILVPRYEGWVGQPFPSDWQLAFKFAGLTVPIDGDDKNPWDLAFDCVPDKQGHTFTCYFENGSPTDVSVDG